MDWKMGKRISLSKLVSSINVVESGPFGMVEYG